MFRSPDDEKSETATECTPKSDEGRTDPAESNGEDGSGGDSESEKSNTGRDFEMVQHTEFDDK